MTEMQTAPGGAPDPDEGLTIPAMPGVQGGRTVYMAGFTMPRFKNQIPVLTETPKKDLKEQRIYDPKHAADIADYLRNVDDYVLPPVVITLDREPKYTPAWDGAPFGYLTISPDTNRIISDGMHRGDGITQAVVGDDGKLTDDFIGAWLVVEPSRAKRRNMFSDINHNQKGMPKSLTYTFDSRDPYAVALRQVVEEHDLLIDVVEEERSRAPKGSGKLFTMAALYAAIQSFAGGSLTDVEKIKEQAGTLFDIVQQARPELTKDRTPIGIDNLRKRSIIASSTTLRVIAAALHRGLSRGYTKQELTEALSKVSFDPAAKLWRDCGFTSEGSRSPSSRNQEVRAAMDKLADTIAPVKGD